MNPSLVSHKNNDRKGFLWLLLFTALLHSAGLIQVTQLAMQQGFLSASIKWRTAIGLNVLLIFIEIALLFLCQTTLNFKTRKLILRITLLFSKLGWINLILSLAILIAFTYLVLSPSGHLIPIPFTRLFFFWLTVLIISLLIKAWSLRAIPQVRLRWFHWLGITWLITAFGYIIFSYYPDISSYPNTITWSETSRYYYASLFLSKGIYGIDAAPTVLHPSRYILQAFPFLLPNTPLILHRAWQVFLWIAITLITAYFITKRSGFKNAFTLLGMMVLIWSFIYLLVGPVYYHLQIPLILILWGFNRSKSRSPAIRLIHNLVIVLLASAWAGISRVNWFPVPGLLAATLIFIEQPLGKISSDPIQPGSSNSKFLTRSSFLYGIKAVAWTAYGFLIAIAAQYLYIVWSGNSARDFTSSFNSDLLWYRLWPSSTYPLGILPGVILVSLPLALMIWAKLNSKENDSTHWRQIHPIRLLGLLVILLVLFVGGLVVSVKIGGGSNLHNMDAYMALLLVTTLMISFSQLTPDQPSAAADAHKPGNEKEPGILSELPQPIFNGRVQVVSLILGLIIPISLVIIARGPTVRYPSQEEIKRGLTATTRAIESVESDHKEVLFLTNRHWLTFGDIKDITLISDYERVFLMEMAMANNQSYLEQFHQDLANHRFDLIVSEPIFRKKKDQALKFAEENNAWVEQVSTYILCYYKTRAIIKPVNVHILIPREKPGKCE
jgi:hypothetical protein